MDKRDKLFWFTPLITSFHIFKIDNSHLEIFSLIKQVLSPERENIHDRILTSWCS